MTDNNEGLDSITAKVVEKVTTTVPEEMLVKAIPWMFLLFGVYILLSNTFSLRWVKFQNVIAILMILAGIIYFDVV